MSTKTLSTTAERNEAKNKHLAAIKELNSKKEPFEKELNKLHDDNYSKNKKRDDFLAKMKSKKSTGKTIIIIGIIAAIAGAGIYLKTNNLIVAGAAAAVGVLLLILGVITFNGHKKFASEYDEVDQALREYDRKVYELNEKISDIDNEISSHESEIESIDLKEKYAKVDEWIESISTGHIGMYVSGEVKYGGRHEEPTAKKYSQSSGLFSGTVGEVYLNGMVYGTVSHNYERDFEIFEADESGTQKLECVVYYRIGNSEFNYPTQAKPVKLDKCSKFCWFHVETCLLSNENGTKVYGYSFDDFEAFLNATGITKDEIMEKFIK